MPEGIVPVCNASKSTLVVGHVLVMVVALNGGGVDPALPHETALEPTEKAQTPVVVSIN